MKTILTPNKICFNLFNSLQKSNYKTKEEIIAKVHKYNGFPDLYGRFLGKKYDSDYFVKKALKNGSNACNYLLSCDMGFNPLPNTSLASYESGFGDFTLKADIDSLREINYIGEHKQMLFFADLYNQQTDKLITHAPRYMTRKALNELNDMGYSLQVECNINFTAFFEKYKKLSENFNNSQTITEHSNLYSSLYKLNYDEFLNKLENTLKVSGINIEEFAGHTAPGQFKISIKSSDGMEACDNITMLKLAIKKLADDSDKTISFMAKINEHWIGNSLNFKLIIKDRNGNNLLENHYYDGTKVNFRDSLGENFTSGILRHLSDFIIYYAPTVNSYKRLKENQIQRNWNKLGFMREDCAVNIITERNLPMLLFKLSGSDVNPYLTLWAIVESIKSGLTNKFKLDETLFEIKNLALPINLNDSLTSFKDNAYMKSLIGDEIHNHYCAFFNFEYTEFMNQVDEWEVNRYLYRV